MDGHATLVKRSLRYPGARECTAERKTIEAPCRHGERGLATLDDTSLDVTTNFVPRASCGQPKVTGCVSKWCDFQNGSVRRRISRNTLVEATIRARPGDLVRLAVPKLCREPHSADATVKLVKLGVAIRTKFFPGDLLPCARVAISTRRAVEVDGQEIHLGKRRHKGRGEDVIRVRR